MKSNCCNSNIHILEDNSLLCINCLDKCKSNIPYYKPIIYIIVLISCFLISSNLQNKPLRKIKKEKIIVNEAKGKEISVAYECGIYIGTIKATIKDHGVRNGVKQTLIQRPKVI